MSNPPLFGPDDDEFFQRARLFTASGRAAATGENIDENIKKLQAIKPRDAAQRTRIATLIASLKQQQGGGTPNTSGPEILDARGEPMTSSRDVSGDVVRGAGAGLANTPDFLGDLALTVPSFVSNKAKDQRAKLREDMMANREVFDPRGTAGNVGEFIGGAIGGAPAFGATAAATARALGLESKAASWLLSSNVGKRVLANIGTRLAAGAPLNIAQILSMEDAPASEKAKMAAILAGAEALGGTMAGAGAPSAELRARLTDTKPSVKLKGAVPSAERSAELQAKLDQINAKKADLEQKAQDRTQAKAEWQVANPGKKWTDLSKEERNAQVQAYIAKKAPPPPPEEPPAGAVPAVQPPPPPIAPSGGQGVVPPVGVEGTGPSGGEAPVEGKSPTVTPDNVESFWNGLPRQQRIKYLLDSGADRGTAEIFSQGPWKDIPEAHQDLIETINGRAPRDAEGALDKFESGLRNVVEGKPPAPVDEASIVADDLKPENIGKDWNSAVQDAERFPRMKQDLKDWLGSQGLGDMYGKQWEDLSSDQQAKWIKLMQDLKNTTGQNADKGGFNQDYVDYFVEQHGQKKLDELTAWWNQFSPEEKAKIITDTGGFDPQHIQSISSNPNMLANIKSYWDAGEIRRPLAQGGPKPNELSQEQRDAIGMEKPKRKFSEDAYRDNWEIAYSSDRVKIAEELGFEHPEDYHDTKWSDLTESQRDAIRNHQDNSPVASNEDLKNLLAKAKDATGKDKEKIFSEWWDSQSPMDTEEFLTKLNEHYGVGLDHNEIKETAAKWWKDLSENERSFIKSHLEKPNQDRLIIDENAPKSKGPYDPRTADWWNKLPDSEKDNIAKSLGFEDWSTAQDFRPDWENLFPEEARAVDDYFRTTPEGKKPAPKSKGVSYEDVGIQSVHPPAIDNDPAEWWDRASPEEKYNVLKDYDPTTPVESGLERIRYEHLDPELQSHVNKAFNDIYGDRLSPSVDVGRTVYEPSASERAARTQLPPDMKNPLMDLLIESHVQGWDDKELAKQLDKFAAENELSPEQVRAGAAELGHDLSPTTKPVQATPAPESVETPPSPASPSTPPTPATPIPSVADRIKQLTDAQIDDLKEQLFKRIDANPNDQQAQAALQVLAKETQARQAAAKSNDLAKQYSDMQVIQQANQPREAPTERMDPKELGKLARTSPRKLSDTDLGRLIDEVGYRIAETPKGEGNDWRNLFDKLVAEKAQREPPTGPVQANIPPGITGAAAGMTYAMATQKDEDDSSRILLYAMLGAGAEYAVRKMLFRPKIDVLNESSKELFPGQHDLPNVISYIDERKDAPMPAMTRARRFYSGMVRSVAEMEYLSNKLGAQKLPIYYNFAKRAAIFGRWIGKAEFALTHGPVIEVNGEPVSLGALPPTQIKEIAQGDIKNLDELAVARTVLEQMAANPARSYPMDQLRATMTFQAAPEYLHRAADEMRKFALAGAKIAADGGLIAANSIAKFANETWYATLQRVFGDDVSRKDLKNIITSPQPIKGRMEGSTQRVKSPFEAQIEMMPKVIRAAEYNKIKQDFITFVQALPKDVQSTFLKRSELRQNESAEFYADRIAAIKQLLPEISNAEAANMAVSFSEEITDKNPHMTVYEDGVLRSYRINDAMFDAFKAMTPMEHNAFVMLAGGVNRAVSKGIVFHPWFIGMQAAFIEPFQAALQSSYGFVPIVDDIRGWWNIVKDSPQYKKILAAGGVGSIQSLPYATVKGAIQQVEAGAGSPLERAVRQIKEYHPFQAWKTLTAPLGEAARMGEALRALDHGESTLEAAYAAWHVLGNTRMEGYFGAMRAFNHMVLFARPAISAIDELVTKAGVNPFRDPRVSNSNFSSLARSIGVTNNRLISGSEFMLKGFTYITIPSMMLWAANKDDTEITKLRQTESGQRYWFFRTPDGDIGKIRKPHILGQMFGGTAEHLLDKANGLDPAGTNRWIGGLLNDAAFNMLPQFGVIPASLVANKNWGLGQPVVPEGQENLDTQFQGRANSSNPARIVADAISPLANRLDPGGFWTGALRRAATPAGLDFIGSTVMGILGQDAVRAVDTALRAKEEGLPPAKDEWPMIGRLYAKYPSMNTRNIRDFYDTATKLEITNNSLHYLISTKPESSADYIQRHQLDIAFAPVYIQTREQISNLHRSIAEMKELFQKGQMTREEYDKTTKAMLESIDQMAQEVNQAYYQSQSRPVGDVLKALQPAMAGGPQQ